MSGEPEGVVRSLPRCVECGELGSERGPVTQGRGALEALVLQMEPRAAAPRRTQSRLELTVAVAASLARISGAGTGLQTVVGWEPGAGTWLLPLYLWAPRTPACVRM